MVVNQPCQLPSIQHLLGLVELCFDEFDLLTDVPLDDRRQSCGNFGIEGGEWSSFLVREVFPGSSGFYGADPWVAF